MRIFGFREHAYFTSFGLAYQPGCISGRHGGGMSESEIEDRRSKLEECAIYSRRFREAIEDYELLPTELRLLQRLCLETFDAGLVRGQVAMERWAAKLRMRDAKGLRVDKCEKVFKSVCDLGIVDLNAALGTFELRPDPLVWSRVRALYGVVKPQSELSLCAERPLSESLSELSREQALKGVPVLADGHHHMARDWHALFTEMNAAVQAGPAEVEKFQREHPELFSAEKSAEVRRKNPPTDSDNFAAGQNRQSSQVFAAARSLSAEKSADKLIASLAVPVQEAQLAKAVTSSAEKSAEALDWVRSVDRMGQLADRIYGPQWERLCLEYPNYVLSKLKRRFEKEEDGCPGKLWDPLAYLSRKAREDGRMRR